MTTSLPQHPFPFAPRLFQGLWAVILALTSLLLILGIPARFAQLNRVAVQLDIQSGTLSEVEVGLLSQLGLSLTFYAGYVTALEAVAALSGILVGAIIFWKKHDDWMAMLVSVALTTLGTFPTPLMTSVANDQPALGIVVTLLQFIAIGPSFLIFYIFPDGRFRPAWTKWIGVIWMISSIAGLFFPALRPPGTLFTMRTVPGLVLFWVLFVLALGIYAQVYRYRRYATPVQRQQTKWIVFGFILSLTTILSVGFASLFFDYQRPSSGSMLFLLLIIGMVLLALTITPITVMFSILQFRLWDIDILIRRTLQYSLLSGLLALIYFGLVVVLQSLLSAVGSQQSEFVTVASTLTIAALFFPLRNRIQNFIDKRFYRQKYNAQKVLADFSATCRDETDLDKLTTRLAEVVDDTLQPETVSVWLRKTADSRQQTAVGRQPSSVEMSER
ncbi:MAG: hypothetical protein ACT4QE_19140 [Anaerolineales bacterium]